MGLLDGLFGGGQQMQSQAPGQGLLGQSWGDFTGRVSEMAQKNPEALYGLAAGLMRGEPQYAIAAMGDEIGQYRKDQRKEDFQREGWARDDARFDKTFGLQQAEHNARLQAMGTERAQKKAFNSATFNYLQSQGAPEPILQMAQAGAGREAVTVWQTLNARPDLQFKTLPDGTYGTFDAGAGAFTPLGSAPKVGGSGFEVTTPDGTTIRQGNFSNQDQKNVANRVTEDQEAAASASALKQTVQVLRRANDDVGYSGVGGGVYDAVDSTLEQWGAPSLPGSTGARAQMKSGGLDVALSQVQKTKGAISNAEMALFMSAAPGLQNTPGGNAALLDMIDSIADRQIQRTQEMEKWRQQYGTLDGFESAWGQHIQQNPLIVQDSTGSIKVNDGSSANQTSSGVSWSVEP